MKLISTGGTGLIGRGALKQALAHPDVTEVIALVRRPIEDDSITRNRKVKQVIVADGDFLHYDEKVVEACQGAVGCVWYVSCISIHCHGACEADGTPLLRFCF